MEIEQQTNKKLRKQIASFVMKIRNDTFFYKAETKKKKKSFIFDRFIRYYNLNISA